MSGNQLSIPDKDREEPVVVQQFIDVPQEQSSAVQVSLAKRIITPNSSKVLCLAARTSVPVADEETASISDLALKLADGTNVVVSLSYFNDATVQNCLPLTRTIYNPDRYTVTSDSSSSLGKVFFTIAMAAVAGFFCLANKPNNVFHNYLHWNYGSLANLGSPAHSARAPGSTTAKETGSAKISKVPSKGKTEIAKTPAASPKPITFVGPPPSKNSTRTPILTSHAPRAQRVERQSRRATSSRAKAPRSYSSSPDRDSMLVPPPPPVMMLNSQPDPNMMRYFPEMWAPQAVFPKAAVTKKPKRLPPPPDSVTSFVQSAPAVAPKQFQIPPAADPVSLMQQQEVVMRPAKPHIKRVEIMSAPTPGYDPNYPPMERIQYPAPDSASL